MSQLFLSDDNVFYVVDGVIMCFCDFSVVTGCFKCKSRLGFDSLINDKNAKLVNKIALWPFAHLIGFGVFMYGMAFPVVAIFGPEDSILVIFWILFMLGNICAIGTILMICIVGKTHIILHNAWLIESKSGCCFIAFRRRRLGLLADVDKFYTAESKTTTIGGIPARDLYVRFSDDEENKYKLMDALSTDEADEKVAEMKQWWNEHELTAKYDYVQFKSKASLKEVMIELKSDTGATGGDGDIEHQQEFEEFMNKVIENDFINGQLIEAGYQLNKKEMIDEYKQYEKHVTFGKLADKCVIKARGILKLNNVRVD